MNRIMNNWLLKYFYGLCEIYACTKYLITSMYIFRFTSNLTNVIMIIESLYSSNIIFKCFV